jgi:hypothetical protein
LTLALIANENKKAALTGGFLIDGKAISRRKRRTFTKSVPQLQAMPRPPVDARPQVMDAHHDMSEPSHAAATEVGQGQRRARETLSENRFCVWKVHLRYDWI